MTKQEASRHPDRVCDRQQLHMRGGVWHELKRLEFRSLLRLIEPRSGAMPDAFKRTRRRRGWPQGRWRELSRMDHSRTRANRYLTFFGAFETVYGILEAIRGLEFAAQLL